MKRLVVFCMALILLSCSKDEDKLIENPELIGGKWKLIELYLDPGDGSGKYKKVDSEMNIEFKADAKLLTNGNLCQPGLTTGDIIELDYTVNDNIAEFSSNGFITIEDCYFGTTKVSFSLDGNYLFLNYVCFEGCGSKFGKISR